MDALLAEPRTKEEHDILLNFLRSKSNDSIWLGATKLGGSWVWQSNSDGLSYDLSVGNDHPAFKCIVLEPETGVWKYTEHCQTANKRVFCQKEFKGNMYVCKCSNLVMCSKCSKTKKVCRERKWK